MIFAFRIGNSVPSENSTQPKVLKQNDNKNRPNEWRGKAMYSQYVQQIEDKGKSNAWKWLRKSKLKECTEALTCSAQEQTLNYVKFCIDKTGESTLCRVCRVENKTLSHIASECKILSQIEYKKRHDKVCRYIHYGPCEKHGFQGAQEWY